MSRKGRDITEAELGILQELWRRESATIRELMGVLYPDGGNSSYATVQKLLERLEAKGHVERDRAAGAHIFRPATRREDLIDRRLAEMADALCEGSLAPLITRLVERSDLDDEALEQLRGLIDRLDRKSDR